MAKKNTSYERMDGERFRCWTQGRGLGYAGCRAEKGARDCLTPLTYSRSTLSPGRWQPTRGAYSKIIILTIGSRPRNTASCDAASFLWPTGWRKLIASIKQWLFAYCASRRSLYCAIAEALGTGGAISNMLLSSERDVHRGELAGRRDFNWLKSTAAFYTSLGRRTHF
jgi:hypothetical protein